MLAKELMSTDVFSVDEDREFNQVEVISELHHVRHVPITNAAGKLCGIISLRDLLSHLTNRAASHFIPIRELMNPQVITAGPDTPVQDIAKLMITHDISCVPIVENMALLGLISERDFLPLIVKGNA